jgi:ribonucleoside-diphosphate reductase alpha chain
MGAKDFERPFSMRGLTTKIRTPHGSMFVTVNFLEGKVKEVFVVVSKPGSELRACAEALGRVISLALQKGVPAEDIAETLENIKTEQVSWNKIDERSFSVSSIPDGIAKVIRFALSLKNPPDIVRQPYKVVDGKKQNNLTEGLTENPQSEFSANPSQKKDNFEISEKSGTEKFEICPECHSSSLIFQEGCYICMSCGYTKCS